MALQPSKTSAAWLAALSMLTSHVSLAQTKADGVTTIFVIGRTAAAPDGEDVHVGGFGKTLARTPQSITVLGADILSATATANLSQLIKLDASMSDSYNTTGYVESLSIRGFLLDQSSNFLRNGLATSNYAPIALENKERVEVLKGVAGMQTGVSAPGGLVNYVTKVPVQGPFNTLVASLDGFGGNKLHLDTNMVWSNAGVRINLAAENLRSHFDHASGSRRFASIAFAGSLSDDTSIAIDFENHYKSQPSVPGLGLLDSNGDGVGDRLPGKVFPRLNLNNQPWSLPFQTDSTALQFVLRHRINSDWQAKLAATMQRTRVNDRLTFPDGCSSAANYVYPGLCANGDVDIYDYRSDGEVRRVSGWEAELQGHPTAFGVTHRVTLGLSGHLARADLPPTQAYNYVGTTNIFWPIPLPQDPTLAVPNVDAQERATAAHVSVVSDLTAALVSFAGVRVTDLTRRSVRSDGSDAVAISRVVSTPWAGIAWSPADRTTLYASWGQGIELEAVPNRPSLFSNSGATLPPLKSAQTELGWKWQAARQLLLTAALFTIDKPYADDLLLSGGTMLRGAGAKRARHRGLELSAGGHVNDQLLLQTSATFLDARYTAALDPTWVDRRVTNVPRAKLSAFADYKLAGVPGLSLNTLLTTQSSKTVTIDGGVQLPGSWQVDAGLRYQHHWAGRQAQWSLGIENLANRSYWREAPTQSWGGIYLFPAAPRTVRASLTLDL